MPPRICSNQPLLNCIETALGNIVQPATRPWQAATWCSRSFSTTSPREQASNNDQRRMRRWLKQIGKDYKNPIGRPNYLTGKPDQPFPLNPSFRSFPVLSEDSRDQIWDDIIVKGEGLKQVSAKYGVDIRRVAAVVRLKEVEKQWEAQGKPLARPYARAVLDMLPRTRLTGEFDEHTVHEPTGDVHVHSHTMQQIFLPTSESRHFTRADAARAFGDRILPVDKTVQIPELIKYERLVAKGVAPVRAYRHFRSQARRSEKTIAKQEAEKMRQAEKSKLRVQGERYEFRFTQFDADNVGLGGRSRDAVGHKYGVPHYDRRKGQNKIPTQVGPKDLRGLV